jgi:gas vesicle protein
MWLVPRAAEEFRDRTAESARRFSKRAAEQFRDASTRVADAASELARKGNGIRDEVADTVARGAHEVERLATAARSDRR